MTVTGKSLDSVANPVMVTTAVLIIFNSTNPFTETVITKKYYTVSWSQILVKCCFRPHRRHIRRPQHRHDQLRTVSRDDDCNSQTVLYQYIYNSKFISVSRFVTFRTASSKVQPLWSASLHKLTLIFCPLMKKKESSVILQLHVEMSLFTCRLSWME